MSMSRQCKEGFIWKLSGGKHWLKNWKRRWFVLDSGQLCYYSDAQLSECKGRIPLAGYTFRRCFRDDLKVETNKEGEDRLVQKREKRRKEGVPPLVSLLLHPNDRCYSLRFDTGEDGDEWERALSHHIPVDLPTGVYLSAGLRRAVDDEKDWDGVSSAGRLSMSGSGSRHGSYSAGGGGAALGRSGSGSISRERADSSAEAVQRSSSAFRLSVAMGSSFFSRETFSSLQRSNYGVHDDNREVVSFLFEHIPFFSCLSTYSEQIKQSQSGGRRGSGGSLGDTSESGVGGKIGRSKSVKARSSGGGGAGGEYLFTLSGRQSLSSPLPSRPPEGYDIDGARYFAAALVACSDTSFVLEAIDRVTGERVAIKVTLCTAAVTGDMKVAEAMEEQAEAEVSVLLALASIAPRTSSFIVLLKQSWSERPSKRGSLTRSGRGDHPASSVSREDGVENGEGKVKGVRSTRGGGGTSEFDKKGRRSSRDEEGSKQGASKREEEVEDEDERDGDEMEARSFLSQRRSSSLLFTPPGGSTGMVVYTVQEFAPFGSIADMQAARQDGRMTETETRRALSCLLRALSVVHSAGYVHRDIKTDNCFVFSSDFQSVKLGDFALAKLALNRALIKDRAGTIGWMAPEVVEGGGYGRKADIFSAGLVAFSMLTGTLPWSSMLDNQVLDETLSMNLKEEIEYVQDEPLHDGSDFEEEGSHLSLFVTKRLGGLSEQAQNFLKVLLSPSPVDRPTAEEALHLPWLKQ
eukprot:CAMPEP_0113891528 /NCGR_PEP_ID=MMETSP0780_2-20120614/14817_1 /TAXON_ID=652834 /ORGANISM="Palpitomonas bilix" /LENGTH=745 /DNA_ID=CAMNT_0000881177 /DNA_START=47 /DNA_END=2284 /DNA_ORIENTATION=+ /assembly_acc=CAM_ASM_000599